jgi:hypothetical protein
VYTKDGKSYSLNESAESPYFGSSVHYGARDFYGSSPPKHTVDTSSVSDRNDYLFVQRHTVEIFRSVGSRNSYLNGC